jgi:hypothetical protein
LIVTVTGLMVKPVTVTTVSRPDIGGEEDRERMSQNDPDHDPKRDTTYRRSSCNNKKLNNCFEKVWSWFHLALPIMTMPLCLFFNVKHKCLAHSGLRIGLAVL